MPDSPEPASSSTGFQLLETLTGLASWRQEWPALADPFAKTLQSINEGTSPQQQRAGLLPSHHHPSSPSGTQSLRATATSVTSRGIKRGQPERKDAQRPERKHTKRRKTGPDRFENYLHGDMSLPPNTTTINIFEKYPNHIADEDIEECWRIGLSARQISELMPKDTHFNSEGVHVQQHHSLIQKKFKTFKERHEMRLQSMRDRTAHPEGQDLLGHSSTEVTSAQEGQNVGSNAGRIAQPSRTGATIELPDLRFRHYPFDPTNDQAFEARMSIKLCKIEPAARHPAYEDHEIRILGLLINQEVQRHGDLLKHRFIQSQPSTNGIDADPSSEMEGRLYQQRLLSYMHAQRASLYRETSAYLSQQSGIPWIHTAGTGGSPNALRLLQVAINHIYLQSPINTAPPSTKRPLFNFDHADLRRWRVLARLLYYLTSITRNLEYGTYDRAASTQAASSVNINRLPRLLGEVRARPGSHMMAASDERPRSQVGLLPVMHLPPAAFYQESSTVSGQQSLHTAFGPATLTASRNGPQARTYASSISPPTAGMIPSTYEMTIIGHEGIGADFAFTRPPHRSSLGAATTRNLSVLRSAFAGATPEGITPRTYSRPSLASPRPPETLRDAALPSPRPHAIIHSAAGLTRLLAATEAAEVQDVARKAPLGTFESPPGLEKVLHGAGSTEEVTQDMLWLTEAPQTLAPSTDSVHAEMTATADEFHFETDDYVLFPEEDRENEDYIEDMFDWDAFDWGSIGRAESPNTGD